MGGTLEDALEVLRGRSAAAPDDALLRRLQEGLVLHEAGDYAESNRAFEWAEREADRRYTRSLSRAAASLVVNDGVMAYTPTAAELVMIPYYRMLNYLALDDLEGAAVEAKKAGALLARLERGPAGRCGEGAMVQYLAGLVLAASGERNDALVSLRRAQAGFDACGAESRVAAPSLFGADLYRAARSLGVEEVADSAAARYGLEEVGAPPDAGDLVLLLEHGFVAHRAEEALYVPILPADIEGLESGEAEGIVSAAAVISTRLLGDLSQKATWGYAWSDDPVYRWAMALDGAYILRLAWPVYRQEAHRPAALRVWVDSVRVETALVGDLSTVARNEFEDERPEMLARLVARGVAKYLVSREAERKAEKQGGEIAGFLVARLTNLAANELEQADTRSWSLLPDRISVARLRLPAGAHHVRVEALSASGEVLAVRDLGTVTVDPGGLVLLNERVWGAEAGG